MTTKQLRLIRGLWTIAICLVTTAIYTTIIKALPGYLDNYNGLRVTAKIFRFFSIALLFGGACILIFKDFDIDYETGMLLYGPVYLLALFEISSFIRYLRVRIFGFHHFYAFGDNLGILVIIQAVLVIVLLCVIRSVKHRRVLFENHSWKNEDDEDIVRMFTMAGLVFSVATFVVIGTVETLHWYMYKPSCEVDGNGYVELGLESGTKWADRNMLSSEPSDVGFKSYLEGASIEGNIAKSYMGDEWSVPTQEQWNELIESCKSLPSYFHGKYGMTFVGRNKIKRIFIPATDSGLYNNTKYWTSTHSYDDNLIVIRSSHCETVEFFSLEYRPWGLIQSGDPTSPYTNECYVRPVLQMK